MRSPLMSLAIACLLCSCGSDPGSGEEAEATDGAVDQPMDDAGTGDAGPDEEAAPDAGQADAGAEHEFEDAGPPDAGLDEETPSDAGHPDAGHEVSADAGTPTQGGLASGLRVRHVALFQAVKVPLAIDGVAVSGARTPIVSGRGAVVRAWVEGSLSGRVGLLDVTTGNEHATLEPSRVPEIFADVPGLQALSFEVPAALVQPQTRYRVRVVDPHAGVEVAPGVTHDARFPADGSDVLLQAKPAPGKLKVVLVPVQYDTDGSHRLPDTSPEQLERMRSLLHSLYPATEVELLVREPMPWSVSLNVFTKNVQFGTLNSRLADLRVSDGAPFDVYYYGLITPAATFSAYCGGSCVTGQSWLVSDPSDADIRVGSGMGFSGEDSVWTLVHELGHQHGRKHAPCNTSGDNNYPHSNARLGSWGYDSATGTLLNPDATKDFMSYCDPTWVSDYTWNALYERISAVNVAAFRAEPSRVATFVVDVEDGEATFANRLPALSEQVGQPGGEVSLLSADGSVAVTVVSRVASWSHGGVTLFVPAPSTPVAALAFTLDGVVHRVQVSP